MMDLRAQANDEAEKAWRRRNAAMACDWRAVATYARHIAPVLRKPRTWQLGNGANATYTITGAAMTTQDIIAVFDDLLVSGRSAPLDDAIAGLADWLAQRRTSLSDDDFAVLTAVGGAMYEAVLQRRAPATFLPVG